MPARQRPLAVDRLGRVIDHDGRRPMSAGSARSASQPHCRTDQPRAARVRDFRDRGDDENVERRLAGFPESRYLCSGDSLAPLVEIESIDQRGGNAVARGKQVFHNVAARSEQRLRKPRDRGFPAAPAWPWHAAMPVAWRGAAQRLRAR